MCVLSLSLSFVQCGPVQIFIKNILSVKCERHTHTHIRRQNRIRQTHSLTLLIYVVWLLYMPTNSVRFASISNLGALHCELWIAHTTIWRPRRTQELKRKRITIEIRTPVLSFKRFYLLWILLRVCRLFLFW